MDRGSDFPHPPASLLVGAGLVGQQDLLEMMSLQSSISQLAETSSNLDRDLEIIDLLERERSMDIQQGLEQEERLEGGLGRRELVVGGQQQKQPRRLPSVHSVRGSHPITTSSSASSSPVDMDQFERLFQSKLNPLRGWKVLPPKC